MPVAGTGRNPLFPSTLFQAEPPKDQMCGWFTDAGLTREDETLTTAMDYLRNNR